jgi:hypothetical protein
MNLSRAKLLLTLLIGTILVLSGPGAFTPKHLLIFLVALLIIFGTQVLKALLVGLRLM